MLVNALYNIVIVFLKGLLNLFGTTQEVLPYAMDYGGITALGLPFFCVDVSQGCQPIWGFNYGEKNYDRVRAVYKRAAVICTFIAACFFIGFQLFLIPLILIFPLVMGIDGVMYAGPIADGAAAKCM